MVTVESAMYRFEFVAARTAVDQIIDLRATLMYFAKSSCLGTTSLLQQAQ